MLHFSRMWKKGLLLKEAAGADVSSRLFQPAPLTLSSSRRAATGKDCTQCACPLLVALQMHSNLSFANLLQ